MNRAHSGWIGLVVIVAAVIGIGLLIIPPQYSSEVNGVSVSCGVPLIFDEDAASRSARSQSVSNDTALLIAAECHERVTGRVAGAVLIGLLAVGALGVAVGFRGRPEGSQSGRT